VVGKKKSWARRSTSERERSSIKFILFCIFDFLVKGVGEWSFDLVSVLIFGLMVSYMGFVGFGLEEFW